jgi:hypothetical protein
LLFGVVNSEWRVLLAVVVPCSLKSGRYKANTGISPRFARVVLEIAPEGGRIKILRGLSYSITMET